MGRPRAGLIINPVAGLGGRVGLKGSDGAAIQARARALGAVPEAARRAAAALEGLAGIHELDLVTYPGEMGADVARASDLEPHVIGTIEPGRTTPEDTRSAAKTMIAIGVELLLFAGGDGTARDIYEAIGLGQPVLGIPAGVKIHSAVYAVRPSSAGELAQLYLSGRVRELRAAEVMDVDEEAFRQGHLSARLYGYLRVPHRRRYVQSLKMPSAVAEASLAEIAYSVVDQMETGVAYIVGPGTTTQAICRALGLEKTLLGVDVLRDRALEIRDANEAQLVALLERDAMRGAKIVITPIGGQGYLLGRGNQQISPQVIQRVGRENIIVVSSPEKLQVLGSQPLLVDTGDPAIDRMLGGYMRVVTGSRDLAVRKVAGSPSADSRSSKLPLERAQGAKE